MTLADMNIGFASTIIVLIKAIIYKSILTRCRAIVSRETRSPRGEGVRSDCNKEKFAVHVFIIIISFVINSVVGTAVHGMQCGQTGGRVKNPVSTQTRGRTGFARYRL